MKRYGLLLVAILLFAINYVIGQNLKPTGISGQYISVKKPAYFDVSPPLRDMIKKSKPPKIDPLERQRREELIEKATKEFLKKFYNGKPSNKPDTLSKLQQSYLFPKGDNLIELENFEGVDNIDGVAPPDTHGDVSESYYMQCVNNHTAIYDKNGNTILSPFPTSDFWSGTPYDDRNDGDAIILWDETHGRWIVTQFYVPSSGTQYLLVAVSLTSDPTGSYYRYAFAYTYMPDYPKWAVWYDGTKYGLYVGANAFDQNNNYAYKGAYISAFDYETMLAGESNPINITILDENKWSVFPVDADKQPTSSLGGCYFITDQVNTTGNNYVYLYQFNVNWTAETGSLDYVATFSVTSYDLWTDDTQVPQPETTDKLDLLSSRTMYRSVFRPFSNHYSIVMCRTINNGGHAAVRWYEFRNSGSGWSVYQQGTYDPGDGLWRWMPSIAINENGDIALGYSVSSSSKYPSIRVVARRATDPLNVMTTSEYEAYSGSASQTNSSRWGDYAMMSIDPSDNTSFWFTTEYTTGGWNWRTRIVNFKLPEQCSPPSTQASNFQVVSTNKNDVTISWTRGDGDRVLVVAKQGAPVDADPANGTNYNASVTFGDGDQIATDNYVVYNGTANQVTIVDLTPGTTYYFAIYEYNTTDNCYLTPALTGNATTTGTAPCDSYCYSYGNTMYNTSTTRVIFNTIDNSSDKSTDANGNAYGDYTNISTDVYIGQTYNLTVQVNTDGDYTVGTKVWIDWNHDCDFDDAGEEYDLGTATNVADGATSNSPLSITIPSSAVTGQTRMRVSTEYDEYPTSCETDFDGEVEDYTLNVIDPNAPLLSISKNSMNFGELGPGYSSVQQYTVSGQNLTDDIILTLSGDNVFSFSLDQTNWSSTLTIPQNAGSVDTTIYVRFKPTNIQNYNAAIIHSSSDANSKYLSLWGEGGWFFPPTNLSGSFAAGTNDLILSWEPPNTSNNSTNWYQYADVSTSNYYSSGAFPKRLVFFDDDDLNYTYPIKITKLRTSFYDNGNWSNTEFKFVIYAADTSTILFESEALNADQNGGSSTYEYTLSQPLVITGDFYVAIVTTDPKGSPFSLMQKQSDNSKYHTFVQDTNGTWHVFDDGTSTYDIPTAVYIDADSKKGKIFVANASASIIKSRITDNLKPINQPKSLLSGYRILEDGAEIAQVDANTTSFIIYDVCGTHTFGVAAIYQGYEGESDTIKITKTYSEPTITQHPQSQSVCQGDDVTFSVSATGDDLTYQWQKDGINLSDGANISGANTETLTIYNASSSDAGSYTCIVSNTCNSITSNAATLTIETSPSITQQPQNQTVCQGTTVTFTVTATGTNLSYQWRKDGADLTDGGNISGSTTETLTISNVSTDDQGSYTCYVSNNCGNTESDPALLTVTPNVTITSQPQSVTANIGDTVMFIVEATGSGLQYQWRKEGIDLSDNEHISGSTTDTLIINAVVDSDQGKYTCYITSDCGEIESDTATLTISLTEIYSSNNNISVYPNPTEGKINIHLPEKYQSVNIYITDMTGRKIYQYQTNSKNIIIDISNFSPGIYNLIISTNKSLKNLKIILK